MAGGGCLEGGKQWRLALVGQSGALLIVSVLIESHNEMSGAGIIVGRRPAATGFPYMEMQLILDLLLNPAGFVFFKGTVKHKKNDCCCQVAESRSLFLKKLSACFLCLRMYVTKQSWFLI